MMPSIFYNSKSKDNLKIFSNYFEQFLTFTHFNYIIMNSEFITIAFLTIAATIYRNKWMCINLIHMSHITPLKQNSTKKFTITTYKWLYSSSKN